MFVSMYECMHAHNNTHTNTCTHTHTHTPSPCPQKSKPNVFCYNFTRRSGSEETRM